MKVQFRGNESVYGRVHTFSVEVVGRKAYIRCDAMRQTYAITLTAEQVDNFKRRMA